eukprot:4309697-Amphidinium_carterae.1
MAKKGQKRQVVSEPVHSTLEPAFKAKKGGPMKCNCCGNTPKEIVGFNKKETLDKWSLCPRCVGQHK